MVGTVRAKFFLAVAGVLLAVGMVPALAWAATDDAADSVTATESTLASLAPSSFVTAQEGEVDAPEETAISIEGAAVSVGAGPFVYSGAGLTPVPVVTLADAAVVPSDCYTVSYENNVDAGKATITVTCVDGSGFEGSATGSFVIGAAPIASVALSKASCVYNGTAQSPTLTVKNAAGKALVAGTDYLVSTPVGRTKVGTYRYSVTGKGNYFGTKTADLQVTPCSIAKATANKVPSKTYTAAAQRPVPTLKFAGKKLKNGTDFKLSYANNKKKGTATITVTGKGNFNSTKKLKFRITAAKISKAKVSGIKAKVYTGKALKQSITVKLAGKKLKKGTDYTVAYSDNVNAGTATVTIKGKGSCVGKTTKKFKVKPKSISSASLSHESEHAYCGWAIEPSTSVRLNGKELSEGADYALSYWNNVGTGTATISAQGIGNYTGSATSTFTIYQVYATRTGECYHRGWCSSLSRSQIPVSLPEAQARGLRPCSRCNP